MSSSDAIITEILRATNHYDVLGVDSMDADAATLRKAYLRRSVKVHPDKNSHADAKPAFQRVAQAWQVLSDDASRQQYDRALRRGRASMNDDYYDDDNKDDDDGGRQRAPRPETYYAGPPPSMQESIFLFATVVGGMMGGAGGKAAANISEALFWAEKLADQRSRTNAAADGDDDDGPAAPATASDQVAVAMAVGSGLQAASHAVRAMGFGQTAQKMQAGARLAQMAGVGVMAAEQPAVRQVLSQGAESWRKLRGGIGVVRAALNQQQQQGTQPSQSPHQQPQQQQQNGYGF